MSRILRVPLVLGLLGSCTRDSVAPNSAPRAAVQTDALQAPVSGTPGPTQARGVDFLIKSHVDLNFCIEVDNGATGGRSVTLQSCSNNEGQRWAFALYSDGTNTLIEHEGMCVTGHFDKTAPDVAITVGGCGNGDEWKFVFTQDGVIQNVKNRKCLDVAGAVGGAAVHLADCDGTKQSQVWTLGR